MRDLVQLSELELQELSAPQRLRVALAVGISVACVVVSLQGVLALFTDARVASLPGLNHLGGQISWAIALVAMLTAVTFLVRGVVKRRLQWAIGLSLLIHFLLCLSISTVKLSGIKLTSAEAADAPGTPLEEFTLPDYGGMEVPDPDSAWQQPTLTDTPENTVELERPQTEIAEAEKPQQVDSSQPQEVQKLETRKREEEVTLSADVNAELERQTKDSDSALPTTAESPEVTTTELATPMLEAQVEQSRTTMETPITERQPTEIASADPEVTSARLESQRTDLTPAADDVPAPTSERMVAEIQTITAAGEDLQVETQTAQQPAVEQATGATRRQAVVAQGSMGENTESDAPSAVGRMDVSSAGLARATGVGNPSEVAPDSGGSVSIARSSTHTANAAAGDAADVSVASSAGVGPPSLSESPASLAGKRGTAASVAMSSTGTGSTASGGTISSNSTSPSGSVGRVSVAPSVSGGKSPQVGDVNGQTTTTGKGEGRPLNAVGIMAADEGVSEVGSSDAATGEAIVASPGRLSPGRSGALLPSTGSMNGSLTGPSLPTSTGAGESALAPKTAAVAPAGRRTEPSARLNANAGSAEGSRPSRLMARVTPTTDFPVGATEAEQSGTLVFAGPQAVSASSLNLSESGKGLVPRRSAGLPGSGSPAGTVAPSPTNSSLPGRVAVESSRSGAGDNRPELASTESLVGLIRRSVPGAAGSPEARITDSLSMRTANARREAAKSLGGSAASEESVERGLAWLARNQYPDGHWSINDFPGEDPPDAGHGSFQSNSAATGLALLAFLGAGYTHQSGEYQDTVNRGITWLLERQKPNGDLFADETEFVWFYSHGIAAISVCEAYGMTKDIRLKEPAQKALDFIVESQHPEFGGWRYRPRFESDTSVSGWQLMALKSGEMAGLTVPKEAYPKVARWLDSVRSKTSAGQFSYHPTRDASPAMTAEGLLMRQYLGARRSDANLIAGARFLRTRLPDFGQRDAYYWYYATQVMFHMQGVYWSEWNAGLRDTLVSTQSKDGPSSGSWDPARPTPEKWSKAGGRHYLTCLNLLMLEVYYRHLPLYLELEK
jgi:hypothetical protein